MQLIYKKSIKLEDVILFKRTFGDLDFCFIRRDKEGFEIFKNTVELSLSNKISQLQLDELFELHKVNNELRFKIVEVLLKIPNIKRNK